MSVFWQISEGDAQQQLGEMPDESVQCCITSPPYYGLRDYGVAGQIGLEETPEEYIASLVAVFHEVRRVLRPDGTLWLNLGDSYATSGGHRSTAGSGLVGTAQHLRGAIGGTRRPYSHKAKDLLGIPWAVAFALRAEGWWLRSEVIWHKPNPMPESVTDRPTRSHETVFLPSKSARYYYDAEPIREADAGIDHCRSVLEGQPSLEPSGGLTTSHSGLRTLAGRNGLGRNKCTVWNVATQPFADAHFATFPPKLVEPMVLAGTAPSACDRCGAPLRRVAGSSEERRRRIRSRRMCRHDACGHCVVLDPFAGMGTTGLVALRHERSFIGVELNPRYATLARERICDDAPLFNTASHVAA